MRSFEIEVIFVKGTKFNKILNTGSYKKHETWKTTLGLLTDILERIKVLANKKYV